MVGIALFAYVLIEYKHGRTVVGQTTTIILMHISGPQVMTCFWKEHAPVNRHFVEYIAVLPHIEGHVRIAQGLADCLLSRCIRLCRIRWG